MEIFIRVPWNWYIMFLNQAISSSRGVRLDYKFFVFVVAHSVDDRLDSFVIPLFSWERWISGMIFLCSLSIRFFAFSHLPSQVDLSRVCRSKIVCSMILQVENTRTFAKKMYLFILIGLLFFIIFLNYTSISIHHELSV